MGLRDFASFFRTEQEERQAESLESARQITAWISQDYHGKFVEWLDAEASKPLPISGNHMDMVQAAVRANTLREVKAYLDRVGNNAKAAIRLAREEQERG